MRRPNHRLPKSSKLRARGLRLTAHLVSASEGRLLDYESADEINRALARAQRELEELKLSLAVQQRRSSRR